MNFIDFLLKYYVWILVIIGIAIVTIIGFLADNRQKKKKLEKMDVKNEKEEKNTNQNKEKIDATSNNINNLNNNVMAQDTSNLVTNNLGLNSLNQINPLNSNSMPTNNSAMINNVNSMPNQDVKSDILTSVANTNPLANDLNKTDNSLANAISSTDDLYMSTSDQKPHFEPREVSVPNSVLDNQVKEELNSNPINNNLIDNPLSNISNIKVENLNNNLNQKKETNSQVNGPIPVVLMAQPVTPEMLSNLSNNSVPSVEPVTNYETPTVNNIQSTPVVEPVPVVPEPIIETQPIVNTQPVIEAQPIVNNDTNTPINNGFNSFASSSVIDNPINATIPSTGTENVMPNSNINNDYYNQIPNNNIGLNPDINPNIDTGINSNLFNTEPVVMPNSNVETPSMTTEVPPVNNFEVPSALNNNIPSVETPILSNETVSSPNAASEPKQEEPTLQPQNTNPLPGPVMEQHDGFVTQTFVVGTPKKEEVPGATQSNENWKL